MAPGSRKANVTDPKVAETVLYAELVRRSDLAPANKLIDEYRVALGCHPGLTRRRNEDRSAIAKVIDRAGRAYSIALVCDGVGSSSAGDAASSLAIASIITSIACSEWNGLLGELLDQAIRAADDHVREMLRGSGATTLSAFIATPDGKVAAANVGDSRIYSWDAPGALHQISVDDTLENELERLQLENAALLQMRGLGGSLSQAIGEPGRRSSELRLKVLDSDVIGHSGVVLATDGAWRGGVSSFLAIAANSHSPNELVRRVMSFSAWTGGGDNASVLAIGDLSAFVRSDEKAPPYPSGTSIVWTPDSKIVSHFARGASPAVQASKPVPKAKQKPNKKKKEDVEPELTLDGPKEEKHRDQIEISTTIREGDE